MTGENEAVLVVEDDEGIAELERRALTRAGWGVESVTCIAEALRLLSERSYSLIVTDYRLPDGEPWQLIEAANLKIPRVPVIMATAMGSEKVAAEALQRGVIEYVKKADGFWLELPGAVRRAINAAAADQSLHVNDKIFQLVAGNLSDVIVVGHLDGHITYVSPACLYILGYQAHEFQTVIGLELVHPDDRGAVAELLVNIGRRVQSSLVYRCRTKMGDYRWIESNVNVLSQPASGTPEVIAISRDVTERKKAEEQITKLNQTLEALLSGAKDYAIFMLDRDGLVATWNSGAERMKGHPAAEIVGKHFSVFHPQDEASLEHAREALKIAESEGRCEKEGWRIRKDGSRFWANVVITALHGPNGELRGFSKVTRNATELKKAADELVAACERAEEASRSKSDFLAAMSHEIRTPMNAILGMSDLLKETELDPVQSEYVKRCRRAGASLLALINDILDLSKIESGRFELERVPFDLEEVVERTMEMIAPRAHSKGVKPLAQVAPGTATRLVGDPVRLQQILINLLGNAVKFTPSGEISLLVATEGSGDAGQLKFEVSDTGIGIPPEMIEAIFEDFKQAESSTTRRFGGTGLGLGIARRLVNCMGGKLSVNSVPGQGSTFSFNASFALDQASAPVELQKGAQDLVGQRVLIVDDDGTNRLIFSKMCLGWGMHTEMANSVSEASLMLQQGIDQQQPLSLVILDVTMPGGGGFEALMQIRAISPDLPIIMTTSNNEPGDSTRARALGALAFAVKPIGRAELLRLVTGALTPQPKARQQAKDTDDTRTRILVAEDSEDNRFLVEAYLSEHPSELIFAEDGLAALKAFEAETFDLVLMDIQMPVMDGLAAARSIRSYEKRTGSAHTPILALTANALLGDSEASRAAGCDGHLAKPISKKELISAVQNFRRGRRVA